MIAAILSPVMTAVFEKRSGGSRGGGYDVCAMSE